MVKPSFFVLILSILSSEDFPSIIYLSKQPCRNKKRPRTTGAIFTFSSPLQTFAVVWEDACHRYLFILGRKRFSPHVFSELMKAWQLPTVPFNRFCARSRGRAGPPRHPAPSSPTAPEATLKSGRGGLSSSYRDTSSNRMLCTRVSLCFMGAERWHPALPPWIPLRVVVSIQQVGCLWERAKTVWNVCGGHRKGGMGWGGGGSWSQIHFQNHFFSFPPVFVLKLGSF